MSGDSGLAASPPAEAVLLLCSAVEWLLVLLVQDYVLSRTGNRQISLVAATVAMLVAFILLSLVIQSALTPTEGWFKVLFDFLSHRCSST